MDLSLLIPSKIRRQVLEYFVFNPRAQIHVNGLARILKAAPQPVYRELINMENWGFLKSFKRGNQRAYYANTRFVFFGPIAEMFTRARVEKNRRFVIIATYDMEELSRELQEIPVPEELIPQLTAPRRQPRAFDEAKILERLQNDRVRTAT